MNSLVGYGVSSDSDSDGERHDVNNVTADCIRTAAAQKTRNFLLESGSASSESEPEDEAPPRPASPPRPRKASPLPSSGPHNPNKLPSPSLNASSDSGVFANPFRAQAEQKLSALQKHVPLTTQSKPSQIGGRRICVSYRKDGRCRFGIKCKFAHDSDLQTQITSEGHPPTSEETPEAAPAEGSGSQNLQLESEGQQAKKRRVGLSNTLIPPKRALKQYAMQRNKEQTNMS